MADVRITPASGSIQFTGSIAGDVLDLIYTGSALQFNTGSTNLIHISSSGFIGFGTSIPLSYNTASFVVNTDAFLAKGLTIGSDSFFNNAVLRFYETDFNITANNVIQSYAFNIGSTPAISIRSTNGNVGIGTDNYPSSARLHVSGGNAWFSDDIIAGFGNYAAGGKVQFVVDSNFMYVGGDINTQITTLHSRFGSVDLTTQNDIFRVQNGFSYQRFGTTFFSASANGMYFSSGQGAFNVDNQGGVNSLINTGSGFNFLAQYPGGFIGNEFNIKPHNGFDIYTGSIQLLGIKPNGDVQIGSATNPNSVLSITGSINVFGSILTTGSLEVSGSINTTGSINVAGNIYTNGTNIQSLSIAYAIALG